jgi:ATP-dependent Lon protease
VRWIDQVLEVALQHQPTPLEESEAKEEPAKTKTKAKGKPLRAH